MNALSPFQGATAPSYDPTLRPVGPATVEHSPRHGGMESIFRHRHWHELAEGGEGGISPFWSRYEEPAPQPAAGGQPLDSNAMNATGGIDTPDPNDGGIDGPGMLPLGGGQLPDQGNNGPMVTLASGIQVPLKDIEQ